MLKSVKYFLYSLVIIIVCSLFIFYLNTNKQTESKVENNISDISIITTAISSDNQVKSKKTIIEAEDIKDVELIKAIGEHFIVGFRGLEVSSTSKIISDINSFGIGGVILFDYDTPTKRYSRNIVSKVQTKKLISDLKLNSDHPIFVSIDAEGGFVNRFKSFKSDAPQTPPAEVVASGTSYKETARQEYYKLATFLADMGFNLNFAPVIDVNVNSKNPIIGKYKRSFSNDPARVEELAKIFIDEHRKVNILTSLKHFPGHGSSETDSHEGLADVTNTYKRNIELIPWVNLIQENYADSVLIGHLFNKDIDKNYPATLSKTFIKTELKKKLNFNGLVISDDMQMGAITKGFGFDDAIIKSLNAGMDIIILSNNIKYYDPNLSKEVVDVVLKAIKNGKISEESILLSAQKIRAVKSKLNN